MKNQDLLTKKEQQVLNELESSLKIPKKKTKKQIVVAMVGLVGSGRSDVAKEISNKIGAVLISADDIRVRLRKSGVGYDNVREIARQLTRDTLEKGGNVVVDSDFIDPDKRNRFKKIAKDTQSQIYYIRTFSEADTVIGRIVSGKYPKTSFFGGASSGWSGKNKGAVVKMREMWRRTPHHYAWDSTKGGKWVKKNLAFVFEEIDTTDSKKVKGQIIKLVKKISR